MMQCLFFIITLLCISVQSHFNFVLIGPPGGGKGTFSSYMIRNYEYYHICPGDMLRAHIKNNTPLGQAIKETLEKGEDVDQSIVYKMVDDEVSYCLDRNIPFIIDGFPRNKATFEFLIYLLHKKNIISSIICIHFAIDPDLCVERIKNRMVCLKCGSVFNRVTNIPERHMECNVCHEPLHIRIADLNDVTIKRLAYYTHETEPLIAQAQKYFKVVTVDSAQSLDDCFGIYDALLSEAGAEKDGLVQEGYCA